MTKTNEDYIREAVELAEGWTLRGNDLDVKRRSTGIMYNSYGFDFDTIGQFEIDALALQLARQVDALEGVELTQDRSKSEVYDFRTKSGLDYYAERTPVLHDEEEPNRAMNIIRAVVDSKVLTKGSKP